MIISDLKTKLNSSLEHLKSELSLIRVGRATTSLVEEIEVDAYDAKMKLKELGTISTPDSQMILISPWDKSLIKEIDRAVRQSGLGFNPVPDSAVVKVPVPPLTEERRKEFAKLVSERAEEAKTSMRNVRQDAMKSIDKQHEAKLITEDERFTKREEVEKAVKEFVSKADELSREKKQDLLSV